VRELTRLRELKSAKARLKRMYAERGLEHTAITVVLSCTR
jgi:hypothetical protein